MDFVNLEELNEIELRADVKNIGCNGISGREGRSTWYTIYYANGEENDIYVK